MEKILVAGATGTTGKIIISLLKDSDKYEPLAMVRKEKQMKDFEKEGVKSVLADLEEDVTEAVKQANRVIFAAGSNGKKPIEVDQEGAKKMADAASKTGIKKFVMLSSMGAGSPEEADKDMKDYMQAKHNADVHLRSTDLCYTIVRPGMLNNENGKGKINLSTKLEEAAEIPRADVAQTLVAVLDDNTADNTTFEIVNGSVAISQAVQTV